MAPAKKTTKKPAAKKTAAKGKSTTGLHPYAAFVSKNIGKMTGSTQQIKMKQVAALWHKQK